MKSAVIVDDDLLSANVLADMLSPYSAYIRVLKIFTSPSEALEYLQHHRIELVFLDVVMPGLSGFELMEQLGKIEFDVIFVTAHEHYALKAIKFGAIDYLLKPLSIQDISKTINKYLARPKNPNEYLLMLQSILHNVKFKEQNLQRVALPAFDGLEVVQMNDIIRCAADRNYTEVFLSQEKKLVISKNLKEIEEMLDPALFFRVHQSHLINLNFIKKYIKGDGGRILMKDNTYVDVSRRKRETFLALLTKANKTEIPF